MKTIDIADEIYRELGEPDDISLSSICFWLNTNLGSFSDMIESEFVSENNEITPDLSEAQKDILKSFYYVSFYQRQVNKNLGAAAYSSIAEIKEGDITVRRVNKTEVAKSYGTILLGAKNDLQNKLIAYKQRHISNVGQFIVPNPIFIEDSAWNYDGPRSILEYTRAI